jgi:hypothetical protein
MAFADTLRTLNAMKASGAVEEYANRAVHFLAERPWQYVELPVPEGA